MILWCCLSAGEDKAIDWSSTAWQMQLMNSAQLQKKGKCTKRCKIGEACHSPKCRATYFALILVLLLGCCGILHTATFNEDNHDTLWVVRKKTCKMSICLPHIQFTQAWTSRQKQNKQNVPRWTGVTEFSSFLHNRPSVPCRTPHCSSYSISWH